MNAENEVLRSLQEQISQLQSARQQQLERDAAKTRDESKLRQKAAEIAQGMIKLNIGGMRFVTSLATLTAVPDTYFTALFSGDWEQVLTEDNKVLIDRDGKINCFV